MKQKPVILYADDDPDDRELLREALKKKGVEHELIETTNGREALLYLRSPKGVEKQPCLILLDLNMPVLNGRETLAIIKSEVETESIPVIVFTTPSSPLDEQYCKRFSVEMVTKPISLQELNSFADRLLSYC